MARAQGLDPRQYKSQSPFLRLERLTQLRGSQFATSEGALGLLALPSLDEVLAAHELQPQCAARSATGLRLAAEAHSADEAQAARALLSPDGERAVHELWLACWTEFADELH